ncbi:MAG: competence/damage-inducible protein A [Anaerolineae bacterium]|nr:competence/damage-inducible protein A [Anaerolineae bacterium]
MLSVEIIAIGNEVLQGDVLDTNSHWLCKQIAGLGGRVERAVIVRDDQTAIVRELHGAKQRQSRLIFTTGGLGPTGDDLTLAAIAAATGQPLAINDEALAMVTTTYKTLAQEGSVPDAAMTPPRKKMARLPQGAVPLKNPVGAAPGMLLEIEDITVVSLPGVPGEMKAIFTEALQPTLDALFGQSAYLEKRVIVDCRDESVLAPILQAVADHHPDVYVKSRAKGFGPDVKFRITLSTAGPSAGDVAQTLEKTLTSLKQALDEHGMGILEVKEPE